VGEVICNPGFAPAFAERASVARRYFTEHGLELRDAPHVCDDDDRRRCVEVLAMVLKPGGRLFLLCFSDEEPGAQGPRRVSKKELYDPFANSWSVESIEPSRCEIRPDRKDISFSEGGPKAWFVAVRREGP
jgi:hypothetical protein